MTRFIRPAGRRIPAAPIRLREKGRTLLILSCAICPEEFTTTPAQFAGRGKRCPGCGSLHTERGTFDTLPPPTEARLNAPQAHP
jgi:hypothetical protein